MGQYQLIEYRPNRWIKVDPQAGFVSPATPQEVAAWKAAQEGEANGSGLPEPEGASPAPEAEPVTGEDPAAPEPPPDDSDGDSHGAPQKPDPKPAPVEPPPPDRRDRVRPLAGRWRVTSTFAGHKNRTPPSTAPGIDLACAVGTEVRAWAAGKVIRSRWSAAGGRSLWIQHDHGLRTYYAHLSAVAVLEGEIVKVGQKIAESGNTGHSTGPHLHFAVLRNGAYVDPDPYLPKESPAV